MHALHELMRPPAAPNHALFESWEVVEQELDIVLPPQLKAFVEVYGNGTIDGELFIDGYRLRYMRRESFDNGTNFDWCKPPVDPACLVPIASATTPVFVYGIRRDGVVSDDLLWIGDLKSCVWVQEKGPLLDFLYRYLAGDASEAVAAGLLPRLRPVFERSTLSG